MFFKKGGASLEKSVETMDYKTSADLVSLDFLGLVVVNVKQMLTGASTLVLPILTWSIASNADPEDAASSYEIPMFARNTEAAAVWLPVLLVDGSVAGEPQMVAFKFDAGTQSVSYWNTLGVDASQKLSKLALYLFSRILNEVRLEPIIQNDKGCSSCPDIKMSGLLLYWHIMKETKVLDSISSVPEERVAHALAAYRAYAIIFYSGKYVESSLKEKVIGKLIY